MKAATTQHEFVLRVVERALAAALASEDGQYAKLKESLPAKVKSWADMARIAYGAAQPEGAMPPQPPMRM